MGGSKDLDYLLAEASPVLDDQSYVFVCAPARYGDHAEWQPIATVAEAEGMTYVVPRETADQHGLKYEGVFSRITLQVHSSLEAVGLTARFATRLADQNISANVFAGFHHDHIFVAKADGRRALTVLGNLADD